MRIAIMGSGGIGGYFGARLASGGADVTFVARGKHLAAMKSSGLQVRSGMGDFQLNNVNATNDPSSIGEVDLVLMGVKLWDTEEAARLIKPLVDRGASVVSFQNGVLKDAILQDILGREAIIGGVSYISASILEPGVIGHLGKLQRLVVGEFDGKTSERVQQFYEACLSGGIDAEISASILKATWEKFVFLVGLSGSTSTIRSPIGPILQNEKTRSVLLGLMSEAVAVGRAHGVPLSEDFAANRLAFCNTLHPDMTSSMHKDLQAGNRLEVGWLSGTVSAMGADLAIPTPFNTIVEDLLALVSDGKGRAEK